MGYITLIVFWISYEYMHHNWELSWPWLTLGNVFSQQPQWVQWYEYTGATGGSLWVLIVNVLFFEVFYYYRTTGRTIVYYRKIVILAGILVLPVFLSLQILNREKKILLQENQQAIRNVVVVQPNIDPYTEKFAGSVDAQVGKLITLSEQKKDRYTNLVIWPETAVPTQTWEHEIKDNFFYRPIWSFLKRHPSTYLLTGIDSYKNYGVDPGNKPASARMEPHSGIWYDAFNTAAFFNTDTAISLYHKFKLVPGVETLPSFLTFMAKWFDDFGGISGTLGRDYSSKVFVPSDEYFKVAPIICYESIYSEYVSTYVKKGANLLAIITNDGWWGNTPGYRQHFNYAKLRAIENRRWVARSANTGISAFINPIGTTVQSLPWDESGALRQKIYPTTRITFFTKYGDFISTIALFTATISIILLLYMAIFKKKLRYIF